MEYSENEFIKLNRKMLKWEWFCDPNTAHLFIFCLLSANWKDGRFQGKEIKRGSFVTSLDKIKVGTGLSIQQIRTALDKLQTTGEITNKSYTKYRVITVRNYDMYQSDNKQNNKQNNKQVTNNQQTNNKQITTIEEDKKIRTKELNKELSNDNSSLKASGEYERKPYQEYIDLWNSLENLGIQPIRSISGKRLISFRARLKEHGKDSFTECIEQIRQSEFLQKSNFFKFDWIVCETNYPKVLEGKYSDKEKQKQSSFDADSFMRRFEE